MKVQNNQSTQSFSAGRATIAKSFYKKSPLNAAKMEGMLDEAKRIASNRGVDFLFSPPRQGNIAKLTVSTDISKPEDSAWTRLKNWYASRKKSYQISEHPELSETENKGWISFQIENKAVATIFDVLDNATLTNYQAKISKSKKT